MFKRSDHRKSDTDLRGRRSLEALRALAHARSSEQIPRHPPLPASRPMTSASPSPATPAASSPANTVRPRSAPRFNLLRSRNASDPTIGLRARDPDPPPPVPPLNIRNDSTPQPPPAIITTSPTNDIAAATFPAAFPTPKRSGTLRLWRPKHPEKSSSGPPHTITVSEPSSQRSSLSTRRYRDGSSSRNSSMRLSRVTFDERERPHSIAISNAPPPYEDQNPSLPLPGPRLSESSRSTASSSGEQTIACSTTTTTQTTTTTTFFRLPRRKKKDAPLFPLPMKVSEGNLGPSTSDPEFAPRNRPLSMISSMSSPTSPTKYPNDDSNETSNASATLAASALGFASPGAPILRSNSIASIQSGNSSPPNGNSQNPQFRRNRSSTMSSLEPGFRPNGRTSLGDFLGRIRKDSEPVCGGALSRTSSPQPHSALSASGSGAVSQEMIIPERHDGDTPPVYLSKLLHAISKSVIASLLARNDDPFHRAVLKIYMETFDFENDPMDMALRKLLMEAELPSETQQIDRVLQAFADRYHECNPFIYQDADQAYFIGFSLIMLHTDYFNKNNKHKMQRQDYVKNTQGAISNDGISTDILECFYHNIVYTPFIRVEDEFDINGEKIVQHRPKRGIFHRTTNAYDGKRIKEPVDPYTLIIDNQLDLLRPSLKDVLQLEDPYSYTGTASRLDMAALHKAFFKSGVLQILSARSRPDAFLTANTMENPEGADPGVVELKVTKVGLLWRKDMKKKTARSPWHEWGAILTGSQLYFFRNLTWIKSLIQQYEQHHKHGVNTPVIFKPALEQFKADAQISTDDTVALLDKNYKKHKHAFAFIRHGNVQEYFIADSEADMNDWLAKLNYAAAFRTAGVRMRGVVGGNYDGQRTRGIRRLENDSGSPLAHSVQTPSGEVSIVRGGIDAKLASEISAARREVVDQRIFEAEDGIAARNRELQAYLRNARHLMILTPVQPKLREQVVMAAGQLAAKLQWVRMEMAKLRCHRDILALDMEEERKTMRDHTKRVLSVSTPPQINSRVSPAPSDHGSPTVGAPSGSATPAQSNIGSPSAEELSTVPSNAQSHKSMGRASWHTRHGSLEHSTTDSASSGAPRSPSASSLMPPRLELSFGNTDDKNAESRSHGSLTPTLSESSFNADHVFGGEQEKEKGREEEKKERSKGKDKETGIPNIRRSLQRTLRESQGLSHKKAKDTNGEDGSPSEKKQDLDEGLSRGSGSFTVHGKKASVVTFGSEWQSMSPEDRLRRFKSAQSGSEAEDIEPLSSMLPPASRRGSETTVTVLKKDEDERALPYQPSRRASQSNGLLEDCPDALEDVAPAQVPAEEQGTEKLNSISVAEDKADPVKADE